MYTNYNDMFVVVEQLIELTRTIEHKICTTLGLDNVHLQVLNYLSNCNKFSDTSTALAEYLGLTRGAVSQTLTFLEKRELISKTNDFKDRRVIRLSLTTAGQSVLKQARSIKIFDMARINLNKEENYEHQAQGFVNVVKALQEASQSKSFGNCTTCYYFTKSDDRMLCGFWKQPLKTVEIEKFCHFHTESNWWQ